MSEIFISHASADNAAAARLGEWLSESGLGAIFLDFDAEAGIPAGQDWEQELYRKLRACKAVAVLCSPASMASRWSFAEIVHARALGKQIFPLLITECQVDTVLSDRQIVDLTGPWEHGLDRLSRGLAIAGIAPGAAMWDPTRPPYPGLMAFDEGDAPVFFGRDEEIGAALEVLAQEQRYGGDGLVIVLGASGSGKSSVLRAGILPRLRSDPTQWLVVDPIRPGERPFAALAGVLARAAGTDFRETLHSVSGADGVERFLDLAHDLRERVAQGEGTLVFAIDQFEELLGHPPEHTSHAFLKFLTGIVGRADGSVLFLATMRSDYLAALQQHPEADGLRFRGLPVGPLPAESLVKIIEEPARVAGIGLEHGLTHALLADAETEGALPLLAFALRELWERRTPDSTLRIADYRDGLGGLQGAVARAADGLLDTLRLNAGEEDGLRRAFLAMVRLDEDGHYARRAIAWEDLPREDHPVLERFVSARLLAARGDEEGRSLEVAHEALFRAWQRLTRWLEDDRAFLLWRQRLRAAVRGWQETGQDEGALLRGAALAEAGRWHEARAEDLAPDDRALIEASLAAQVRAAEAERARQQRDLDQARALADEQRNRADEQSRATRRLRRLVVALGLVLFVAAGAAVVAWNAQQIAVARTAEAEFATARADGARISALAQLPDRATEALVAGIKLVAPDLRAGNRLAPEAVRGLGDAVRAVGYSIPEHHVLAGHEGAVTSVTYSPDGTRLLTTGEDETVRLWDANALTEIVSHRRPSSFAVPGVTAGAFSPNAGRVVVATTGNRALVLDMHTGATVTALEGHRDDVLFAAYTRDGAYILTTGSASDGKTLMWDSESFEIEKTFADRGAVLFADLSPDGRNLASGGQRRTLIIWEVDSQTIQYDNRVKQSVYHDLDLGDWVRTGAFSDNGREIVAANESGRGVIWDMREERVVRSGAGMARIDTASFADRHVVMGDEVVDLGSNPPNAGLKFPRTSGNGTNFSALSSDGRLVIATVTADEVARVWDADTGKRVATLEGHSEGSGGAVLSAAFRPRGRPRVATASRDGKVRLWDLLPIPKLPDTADDLDAIEIIEREAVRAMLDRACRTLLRRPVYSAVSDVCAGQAG